VSDEVRRHVDGLCDMSSAIVRTLLLYTKHGTEDLPLFSVMGDRLVVAACRACPRATCGVSVFPADRRDPADLLRYLPAELDEWRMALISAEATMASARAGRVPMLTSLRNTSTRPVLFLIFCLTEAPCPGNPPVVATPVRVDELTCGHIRQNMFAFHHADLFIVNAYTAKNRALALRVPDRATTVACVRALMATFMRMPPVMLDISDHPTTPWASGQTVRASDVLNPEGEDRVAVNVQVVPSNRLSLPGGLLAPSEDAAFLRVYRASTDAVVECVVAPTTPLHDLCILLE
jgi:hypothetical protein